jgi:ParB family chromosome partitioning protein
VRTRTIETENSMAKNSKDAYGAASRTNLLMFRPEDLVLVTDEKSPLYDKRVHDEPTPEFVANINHYGVKEPILARRNPETGKVEVVAGRSRTKGAVLANKDRKKKGLELLHVPVIIQRSNDLGLTETMALENVVRKDVSPIERAHYMQRQLDLGSTPERLAVAFACSSATVRNTLALLEAPADVRRAVERGDITAANGFKLARMEPGEAKFKLAEIKKNAPRTAGKRNGSAAKAREIIDGKKRPRRREVADMASSTSGEPTIYLRQIAATEDTVQNSLHIPEEIKRQIIACLRALQGNPVEWNEILFPPGRE